MEYVLTFVPGETMADTMEYSDSDGSEYTITVATWTEMDKPSVQYADISGYAAKGYTLAGKLSGVKDMPGFTNGADRKVSLFLSTNKQTLIMFNNTDALVTNGSGQNVTARVFTKE
jgi:hypothetical protein